MYGYLSAFADYEFEGFQIMAFPVIQYRVEKVPQFVTFSLDK